MALTQVKTSGLADDAVTGAKIADDTVAEANMANDAISLTELKAGTDGQIITWDASGNPTAVGPGTDGQVLTSTGAGSPPAFEDVPAGGATINNATANELVTVASTTTQLDAETNLTWDGTHMGLGLADPTPYYADRLVIQMADEDGITLASAANSLGANENNYIMFASTNSGAGRYDAYVKYSHSAHDLHVQVNEGGGSGKGFTFKNSGNFDIGDGNLVVASGHGIDFSATSDAGGMSSELLDDYEVGTWTPAPTFGGGNTSLTGSFSGSYVKVGKIVTAYYSVIFTNKGSSTGSAMLGGFPFTNGGGAEAVNNNWGYFHRLTFDEANDMQAAMNLDGTTSYMRVAKYGTGPNMAACTEGNFTNTTRYDGCMVYRIS